MPLPKPKTGETSTVFVARFMGNAESIEEFPDNDQRLAVAFSTFGTEHGDAASMLKREVVFKLDAKRNDKLEVTSQGFLKIDAFVTRAGIFDYLDENGNLLREFRSPEEVFSQESLDSLKMVPITRNHPNHPGRMVTVDNVKDYQIGVTGENVTREGNFVSTKVLITDKAEIARIQKARADGQSIELSMGYDAKVIPIRGTTDEGTFDAIQTNIRYNHLSIVDAGRAGGQVRLRMDQMAEKQVTLAELANGSLVAITVSKDRADSEQQAVDIALNYGLDMSLENAVLSNNNYHIKKDSTKALTELKAVSVPGVEGITLFFRKTDHKEVTRMKFKRKGIDTPRFKMDAVDVEIGDGTSAPIEQLSDKLDSAVDVIVTQETEIGTLKADAVTLAAATQGKADESQAKLDAQETELVSLRKDNAELSDIDNPRVQLMIQNRTDMVELAKVLKVDTKGMTEQEMKIAIIKAGSNDFKADGKSPEYIDARFDAVRDLAAQSKTVKHDDALGAFRKNISDSSGEVADPRATFAQQSAELHKS